jgi:hypothetical protein
MLAAGLERKRIFQPRAAIRGVSRKMGKSFERHKAGGVSRGRVQRGMSIMFQLRLVMIQTDPTMTRKTMNTPKARAMTLLV